MISLACFFKSRFKSHSCVHKVLYITPNSENFNSPSVHGLIFPVCVSDLSSFLQGCTLPALIWPPAVLHPCQFLSSRLLLMVIAKVEAAGIRSLWLLRQWLLIMPIAVMLTSTSIIENITCEACMNSRCQNKRHFLNWPRQPWSKFALILFTSSERNNATWGWWTS